jgi:hypothetical protein
MQRFSNNSMAKRRNLRTNPPSSKKIDHPQLDAKYHEFHGNVKGIEATDLEIFKAGGNDPGGQAVPGQVFNPVMRVTLEICGAIAANLETRGLQVEANGVSFPGSFFWRGVRVAEGAALEMLLAA